MTLGMLAWTPSPVEILLLLVSLALVFVYGSIKIFGYFVRQHGQPPVEGSPASTQVPATLADHDAGDGETSPVADEAAKLAKIEEQIEKLDDKLLDGEISEEHHAKVVARLEAKREKIVAD